MTTLLCYQTMSCSQSYSFHWQLQEYESRLVYTPPCHAEKNKGHVKQYQVNKTVPPF